MAHYDCRIQVLRDNKLVEISSDDLVPGDVIEIPSFCKMPCDAVLIDGICVMNESMLTGESIPVVKNELPHSKIQVYSPISDKKFTLYSGTDVIQTWKTSNDFVKAIVMWTGFNTTKGLLVKSILYPKPTKFKFYSDSLKFIFSMGILAVIGFLITLP